MQNRVNKPRVFLSHSALDKNFIERLAADLRKCQIEPWRDTEEIRDGKPWLTMIFEDGIPTCDAVLIYLTPNSLKSKMVAKELDAAIVKQLDKSGIAVLPYVSRAELRDELRPDMRALHCREWNDTNYSEILPSVVAEIWRSYLERTINTAILQERNARLTSELELTKLKQAQEQSVFPPSDEKDFQYIHKMLSREIEVSFEVSEHAVVDNKAKSTKLGRDVFKFELLGLILHYQNLEHVSFNTNTFSWVAGDILKEHGHPEGPVEIKREYSNGHISEKIIIELQTYGLLTVGRVSSTSFMTFVVHDFTDKMYRFRYWLGYNNYPLDKVAFQYVGVEEEKGDS